MFLLSAYRSGRPYRDCVRLTIGPPLYGDWLGLRFPESRRGLSGRPVQPVCAKN